jgi:hypothetical protein
MHYRLRIKNAPSLSFNSFISSRMQHGIDPLPDQVSLQFFLLPWVFQGAISRLVPSTTF